MTQAEYIDNLIKSISHNIEIKSNFINDIEFKKLKPFHYQLLWEKSIEFCSIYYENIFSFFHNNIDLSKASVVLINNNNVPLCFFEHMVNKYPHFIINQEQEKIVNYPVNYFNTLFSRTLLTPNKTTHCLYNLFLDVENNLDKIEFIIENQKKKFIPFHEDMYYFILFSVYMIHNSEKSRSFFCYNTSSFVCRPSQMTKEFMLTSKILYQHFDHIFDFIKPLLHKKTYVSQFFNHQITNENDFIYFIKYASSLLQKEKIESQLSVVSKKKNISKI